MRPTSGFDRLPGISLAQLKVDCMHEDDELPSDDNRQKPKPKDLSALPAHLGQKLRAMFADVETQPVPDGLVELLEALAAKEEKKPE
jgi:Anti-sigma factor NepR